MPGILILKVEGLEVVETIAMGGMEIGIVFLQLSAAIHSSALKHFYVL